MGLAALFMVMLAVPKLTAQKPGTDIHEQDEKAETVEKNMWQAKNGDAQAQFILGRCYANGEGGVACDSLEAFRWFLMAAENGHGEAAWEVAQHYRGGMAPMASVLAAEWVEKAAEKGRAEAQYVMGESLAMTDPPRMEEAAAWYLKAAEQPPEYTDNH